MCRIYNILSSREIAIIAWGIAYFLFSMRSYSARNSVVNVLKAFWSAKKALLLFVLIPIFFGVILIRAFLHIELSEWKEIIVWTIFSALLSFSFDIISVKNTKGYWSLIMKIILSIPFIWFIVDFTSFSLIWEMIIIPVFFYLKKLYYFEELKKKENIGVRKMAGFLYYSFFIVWGYSLYLTLSDKLFWSIETLQLFSVPLILTSVYAILVYPILLIIRYDSSFRALNIFNDIRERRNYRNIIWKFCRLNLNKIGHCDFYIYNREYQSSDTLKETINTAIKSYRKQVLIMKFKIIKEDHNSKVENFHIVLEISQINKDAILDFIDYFRKNHTTKQANISIYDNEIVASFCHLNKSLSNEQQSLLSTHWIGYSSFEVPLDVWMYPEK